MKRLLALSIVLVCGTALGQDVLVVDGSIDASDPVQHGYVTSISQRMNCDGLISPYTGGPWPYALLPYDSYPLTNGSSRPICYEVELTSACASLGAAAYLDTFDPASVSLRAIGRVEPAAQVKTFRFTLAPASEARIVVFGGSAGVNGCAYTLHVRRMATIPEGDYMVDGHSDVIWNDPVLDDVRIWAMNGSTIAQDYELYSAMHVDATGNVDRNGSTDLVWRKSDGIVVVAPGYRYGSLNWEYLNYFNPLTDPDTRVAGVGDVNGDGAGDIVWRNATTGENSVWLVNRNLSYESCIYKGTCFTGHYLPSLADPNWIVAGIGDFDGDGKADLAWRNTQTGKNAVWLLDGATLVFGNYLPTVADLDFSIAGTADFNGDGKDDLVWRNARTGENAVWMLDGASLLLGQYISRVEDPSWTIATTGDMNGDGHPDLFWRSSATGANAIWFMNGLDLTSGVYLPVMDVRWEVVAAR